MVSSGDHVLNEVAAPHDIDELEQHGVKAANPKPPETDIQNTRPIKLSLSISPEQRNQITNLRGEIPASKLSGAHNHGKGWPQVYNLQSI